VAVLYIVENPGVTTEFYDKVRDRLKDQGVPRGGVFHVAAKREGGGIVVVEVWESEAAREQWSQQVDKAIAELGGQKRPPPKKYLVHNLISAETVART
jgi:heme-degrading monooxygenase HmoA